MSPGKIFPFHLDTLDLNGKNKVAFSPWQTLEAALRLCSQSGLLQFQGSSQCRVWPRSWESPPCAHSCNHTRLKELPSYPGAPFVLTEQQNRGENYGRMQHT